MYNFSLLCIVKLQICDVTDPCGDYLSIKILLLLIRKLTLLKVHWNLHGYHKTATQSCQFHPVCLNGLFDRVTQSVSEPVDLVSQSSYVWVTLKACYIFYYFCCFLYKQITMSVVVPIQYVTTMPAVKIITVLMIVFVKLGLQVMEKHAMVRWSQLFKQIDSVLTCVCPATFQKNKYLSLKMWILFIVV